MIILKIRWRNVVLFQPHCCECDSNQLLGFPIILEKDPIILLSVEKKPKKLAIKMSREVFPTPFGQMVKEYSEFPRKRRKNWSRN